MCLSLVTVTPDKAIKFKCISRKFINNALDTIPDLRETCCYNREIEQELFFDCSESRLS